jgi:putative ABC transport system substrate-binding protein
MTRNVLVLCLLLTVLLPTVSLEAQQTKKVRRIGYLATASVGTTKNNLQAFQQGLHDHGYVEGKNIVVEYRSAEGEPDRLPELAEELSRLKVEVIVATSTPAVHAARKATGSAVPIVMTGTADPVETGFVASLARPGGNITGLSLQSPELAGKRLELLKEIAPKLSMVAFLVHRGDPSHRLYVKEAQDAAETFGLKILPVVINGPDELDAAFAAIVKDRAGALIVQPILGEYGKRIANLAAKHRLPTISDATEFAERGGLLYYGSDRIARYRRAATYVDKILKGAKPADLPVEQPTKFEFIINLKTAKQIGLTIPPNVLARADKVIR